MIGQVVGDYRILSQLGEGGMGMVYKGEHVVTGQIVAVKSLHATLMNNQAAKDRFVREAQALGRLNHPNIIGLKNFINNAQGCFIVMEYAEGEDLEAKLQKMGLIPPEQCLPWFVDALKGLDFANKQNIIHRDIKPSNIMVMTSGITKLLDFGTAKLVDAQRLTQQGMTLGTVIYMSKEQLLGKPLDARSDVYSLGVTLYECVTGQLPFYDEEERKLVVKIAKEEPIPPSKHYPGISPQLEGIILKAMSKKPVDRFQDAADMEQALTGLLGGAAPVPAPTPGPVPVAPTPAQPAPAAAPGGERGVFLSPLCLAGIAMWIVAAGGGIPAILVGSDSVKLVGIILLLVFGLLGLLLVIAAVVKSRGGATSASGAGGGKGDCPTCGRTMLVGMNSCPFCSPQAAPAPALAAAPVPVAPAQPSFNPGGTLSVNSKNAAQGFGSPTNISAAADSTPVLQVIDGNDKGKQFSLGQHPRITIGRAPSCVLTLNDPGVSGQHASIFLHGAQAYVEDTGSRNGVFVNNQKITRHALGAGDLIVIGSTRMVVTNI